jgi:GNAT superfamily N-acetyltransferase
MEIVEAKLIDLAQILELQKMCYNETGFRYNDFNIPPLVQTLQQLENEFNQSLILISTELSGIIGSIRAFQKDETCYIGRVIVHPNHQNKGIGSKLMASIESKFPNVKRFELFTGSRDEKNLYLYNKLGYKQFKQEEIRKDFAMVYLEKLNNKK